MSLNDTFTLFLSNAVNRGIPTNDRAAKIRKCAKLINGITKEKSLKSACRALRNQKNDLLVISAIEQAEQSYWDQKS